MDKNTGQSIESIRDRSIDLAFNTIRNWAEIGRETSDAELKLAALDNIISTAQIAIRMVEYVQITLPQSTTTKS